MSLISLRLVFELCLGESRVALILELLSPTKKAWFSAECPSGWNSLNSFSRNFSACGYLVFCFCFCLFVFWWFFWPGFMEFYPMHTWITIQQQIPSFYSNSLVLQIPSILAFPVSDLCLLNSVRPPSSAWVLMVYTDRKCLQAGS